MSSYRLRVRTRSTTFVFVKGILALAGYVLMAFFWAYVADSVGSSALEALFTVLAWVKALCAVVLGMSLLALLAAKVWKASQRLAR